MSRINVSVAVMAVLLGITIGYQAVGQRAMEPTTPVVACVKIEKLFDELKLRADAKIAITTMERDVEVEKKAREEEIVTLESKLEETVSQAARKQLEDDIMLKRYQLNFWLQERIMVLEVEKAVQLQYLYKSVREAIAALAAAEGYDIVMMDDSGDELPYDREARIPAQVQILQQIANRKILFMNEAIDVTDDLIVRMNNQFRAGP